MVFIKLRTWIIFQQKRVVFTLFFPLLTLSLNQIDRSTLTLNVLLRDLAFICDEVDIAN